MNMILECMRSVCRGDMVVHPLDSADEDPRVMSPILRANHRRDYYPQERAKYCYKSSLQFETCGPKASLILEANQTQPLKSSTLWLSVPT